MCNSKNIIDLSMRLQVCYMHRKLIHIKQSMLYHHSSCLLSGYALKRYQNNPKVAVWNMIMPAWTWVMKLQREKKKVPMSMHIKM